ncbi:hypothetical protein IQ226_24085 [Dolichospermum sp. LEGE 00240]|uniref:hypothetical protein n=1 Tax=Dolichospermum sp. LEGE 00240 TaxID=1828603 RepID=UPI001882DF85|nr:hypothetical protein [Dolichospermum sp. LEGE 00240]MBE9252117.1 hypothetical protein [Dolichospermum sp. LEGE 00240]MDM3861979.1 hypothetical protein [Aphanizomenon gracile PMC644.10]
MGYESDRISGVVGYGSDCIFGVFGYESDRISGVVGYESDCIFGVFGYESDRYNYVGWINYNILWTTTKLSLLNPANVAANLVFEECE